jgi:hypothetical protein
MIVSREVFPDVAPPVIGTSSHWAPPERLYLDESGDHCPCGDHPAIGQRYLGLVGVIFSADAYDRFRTDLEALKQRHLAYDVDDPPILHREDIVQRRRAFHVLRDNAVLLRFDAELLDLIASTDYRVIATVIDKHKYSKKRRALQHPYHVALLALLRQYCAWLEDVDQRGYVIAESRGGTEDRDLSDAYRRAATRDLPRQAQYRLTSRQVKIRKKATNVAGLQLADLLAHPLTRDVLQVFGHLPQGPGRFGQRIADAVRAKYIVNPRTEIPQGAGQVFLN